uniref:PDZ domain-containing protein n=1 Tax=Phytophthora ramorum TaxID=164328 RepID=H3GSI2_PHYRM
MVASESRGERQIHVLLTLLDGERSFGMSLAQKSPALGPKYTVVSSVFANSPAARAGVRQGYVVRYINDKPMGGLTVAQVANNFRNVAQASITLEIVDTVSPRTSAFTAAVTFGGVSTNQAGGGQRSVAPVTGFSVVSSGRAIAAPGTALAGPKIAAPKQSVEWQVLLIREITE